MIFIGAGTAPAVLPVTLVNGTVADADQVMSDFNALKNYVNADTNVVHATTGSASTQILTYAGSTLSLSVGDAFLFIVGAGLTNTGPATLNVNGTGAKALTLNQVALTGGELGDGMLVFVAYDGTQYQILGASGSSSGSSAAGNNILINPSMEIDQEHEGASVSLTTAAASYVVDGWTAEFTSSTAAVSVQRVNGGPAGFTKCTQLTVGTGAAVAAGDFLILSQPIEANNITDWAIGSGLIKNLILSFWAYSSIGSYTACGALQNAAKNRAYTFNFTISTVNTWEQKFVSIPMDASGGWTTTGAVIGAILNFTGAVGSTFQTAPDVWTTGNFLGTSSCTNTLLSTSSSLFAITGVQLSLGTAPAPFVRRTFSEELAICQRYYEKSWNYGTAVPTAPSGAGLASIRFAGPAGGPVGGFTSFKVTKRVTPTSVVYDNAGGMGFVSVSPDGSSWSNGGTVTVQIESEAGLYIETETATMILNNYDFIADARL